MRYGACQVGGRTKTLPAAPSLLAVLRTHLPTSLVDNLSRTDSKYAIATIFTSPSRLRATQHQRKHRLCRFSLHTLRSRTRRKPHLLQVCHRHYFYFPNPHCAYAQPSTSESTGSAALAYIHPADTTHAACRGRSSCTRASEYTHKKKGIKEHAHGLFLQTAASPKHFVAPASLMMP